MAETRDAALCLLEALIEHLQAKGALAPTEVSVIYDRAVALAQDRYRSEAGAASDPHARLDRLRG